MPVNYPAECTKSDRKMAANKISSQKANSLGDDIGENQFTLTERLNGEANLMQNRQKRSSKVVSKKAESTNNFDQFIDKTKVPTTPKLAELMISTQTHTSSR